MGRRLVILGSLLLAAMAVPSAARAAPDCQCRSAGRFFNQGDLVCIGTNQGPKLGRCDMSQNVSTWTVVSDGCPSALMIPLPAGRRAVAAAGFVDVDRR